MHNFKFGWIIPIAIFFVISFPPWGVWVGFGIVAAGTFIGEIGNFYAFRYLCTSRGEKIEKGSVIYSSLGRVVREGGFKIALIARYSAIPPHFTTGLFAVCGMNIFIFMLAAALSMPKQFITVYIGTLLETSATSSASTKNTIISDVIGVITVLITIAAMWYITREINRVKPQIVYERRKARQAKLDAESESLYQNGGADTSAQWDSEGRAIGYAPDPRIHAPQPKKPENPNPFPGDTTPTLGTKPLRQESTDTIGWELQANAAQGQSYRLSAIAAEPLRNPYEDEGEMDAEEVSGVGRSPSSGIAGVAAYAPPPGPPPPSPGAGYTFSAPGHSFSGASSPPLPSTTRQ
ncbi:hypothetical protein F4604DRAFT_1747865 [Suillus subluteus]|nr:hypothetical protein F4604DRAFT_1747865 [Suillus subluteus]